MSTPKQSTYPPIVAVDTQILIFALRDTYRDEGQRQVSVRAKRMFQEILENKSRIVLSIISVGEYLVGIPEVDQAAVGQELMEQYLIAPYNLRAAIIAARLVPFAKTLVQGDRQVLLADTKIVGSVKAFPCDVFITHDKKCKTAVLASQLMEVRGLPEQLELPFPEHQNASQKA